ncbi:diguanylate cyclase domain-containing protein [Amphibiibacter pelophylacis]|uniref:Diguanylate cyclase n=1 Tax=Amphibiibacter pelophylacis TaxID=1799477 RepID=A0ACC6P4A3_9BURK
MEELPPQSPRLPRWRSPLLLCVLAGLLLLPMLWNDPPLMKLMGAAGLGLLLLAGHSSRRRERIWRDSLIQQENSSTDELERLRAEHAHVMAALDRLPEALVIYDAQERLLLCNQRHRELFPRSAPYMQPGQLLQDIVRQTRLNGEAENPSVRPMALDRPQGSGSDLLQPLADGRWVRLRQKQGSDGSLAQLRVEVTPEVRQQEALQQLKDGLRRTQQMLQEVINALPGGVALYDGQQRLLMANAQMTEFYPALSDQLRPGVRLEDLLRAGLRRRIFPQATGHEDEWIQSQIDAYIYAEGSDRPVRRVCRLADGRKMSISTKYLSGGGYLGLHQELTLAARPDSDSVPDYPERLHTTDPLTGLSSRRYFDVTAQGAWGRGQRTSTPMSVALIDVDQLKAYNDHYGHLSGDDCLRQVGQVLEATLKTDSPPGGFVARYSGEAFVMVLPDQALAPAQALLQRAQQALRDQAIPHDASTVDACVTVSIGLACAIPRPGSELSQLLAAADSALAEAKSSGRNTLQTASLEFPNRRAAVHV